MPARKKAATRRKPAARAGKPGPPSPQDGAGFAVVEVPVIIRVPVPPDADLEEQAREAVDFVERAECALDGVPVPVRLIGPSPLES